MKDMTIQLNLAPERKAQMPRLIRHGYPRPDVFRISASSAPACSFGTEDKVLSLVHIPVRRDNLTMSVSRWKSLEVNHEPIEGFRHSAACPCGSSDPSELSFNRLPPSYEETRKLKKHTFGLFTAREALLDEEYWAASFLRALGHYETLGDDIRKMRRLDASKLLYAEKEFNAIKRRCSSKEGNSLKCFCLVAVKDIIERPVRSTILNSIVGTLDLSIRQYLQGKTYPGVYTTSGVLASYDPDGAHLYGYISNVVVSKSARRQGIASNMLYLAIDIASCAGIQKLFVHANTNNKAAQELYIKVGFKVVEDYSSDEDSEGERVLLSMEL